MALALGDQLVDRLAVAQHLARDDVQEAHRTSMSTVASCRHSVRIIARSSGWRSECARG
jgi:hypothetical protein